LRPEGDELGQVPAMQRDFVAFVKSLQPSKALLHFRDVAKYFQFGHVSLSGMEGCEAAKKKPNPQ
jgi:hypothetical protein